MILLSVNGTNTLYSIISCDDFFQEFEVSEDYNRLNHRRNYLGNVTYMYVQVHYLY